MKNFEMPKMSVAIFSLEDVVTTSNTPTNSNVEAAKAAAIAGGVASERVTVAATDWLNA